MKKNLGVFFIFRFEVLKIDRGAHPAWLTRETLSFPILSTSNRKNEKSLGFFSFFRFDVLKIDRGAHPALADPSQILSDPVKNPNFSEGLGIDLGASESVQFAHFEPFRAIFEDFRKNPQIYSPMAPLCGGGGCPSKTDHNTSQSSADAQ